MAKVVCRIAKLSSMEKIGKSSKHNLRLGQEADRKHIDKNRTPLNQILIGSGDIKQDIKDRLNVAEKCANGKFRANAVLAVEMILSASPEFFEEDPKNLDKWVAAQLDFLHNTYSENVVNAVLHMDETTPHLHVFIVPIDEKNKLNCRSFFGGREKLRELQTTTFKAVEHLGIKRGVPREYTEAQHKEFNEWKKEVAENHIKTNNAVKEACENLPKLHGDLMGFVGANKAHEYYKNASYIALKKAMPSFYNHLLKLNSKIKDKLKAKDDLIKSKDNEIKELYEAKAKAEANAKATRKEMFDLRKEFDSEVKESFEKGHKKAMQEMNEKLEAEKIKNFKAENNKKNNTLKS